MEVGHLCEKQTRAASPEGARPEAAAPILGPGPDRHAPGLVPSRRVSGRRSEGPTSPAEAGVFLAGWAQILHAFGIVGGAVTVSLSQLSPVARGSEGVWGERIAASKWGCAPLGRGSALLRNVRGGGLAGAAFLGRGPPPFLLGTCPSPPHPLLLTGWPPKKRSLVPLSSTPLPMGMEAPYARPAVIKERTLGA